MTSATRTTVAAKIPGLTGGDYTLLVKSSTMELNEARTPYGRIQLVVALPASSVLAQITPYAALRIQGTITHSWVTPVRPDQVRTFDFLLHERTIDHEAATLTLIGQTDEAMLIDFLKSSTTPARTYGLSVKTAVDYALTQIGATLESGAVDATLTSKTLEGTITNLVPNPSAEVNITNLSPITSSGGAVTRSTTLALFGTGSALATRSTTTGVLGIAVTSALLNSSGTVSVIAVTAGKSYVASAYARSSVAGRATGINVQWYNASNAQVGSDVVGATTSLLSTDWSRLSLAAIAPATATKAAMWVQGPATFAVGELLYADGFMFHEGNLPIDYFDGATADTGLYDYAWSGTTHNSASTKTNLPNTDATIWLPGQSLDRWLEPILQAGNRRLFCDEHRKWRLVDGSYAIDGTLSVAESFNAKRGTDTMSRQKAEQGVPTWFDHVAVHYSWKDALGVSQEMWDFASSGSVKGYLVEVTTPWPGPGAAAGILSRAAGRGRTQDVTALTDYAATPGMAIVTTLPGTPIQSGVLSSVAWRWDNNADDMTVTSRGLTNTPANAWLFALGAWSAATGSWAAATGTN